MAINKAIIQIRRGPKDDLQFDKLLPGELAIATDAPCMWFCWAVGEVEQIPTSDNIEEVIAEIIEKYLKDNPVTGISEIYMRVYEGYIQYSSDGETYNDLISVSELKGAKGDPGSAGVGIRTIKQTTKSSEDGGTNVITITLSNDTKVTFDVLNGQKGSPGNAGVGIQSISQQTGNLNGGKNTIQIVLTNGNVQEVFTYNGKNGSDANVTLANIVKALGFTPVSEEFVNNQVSTITKFELEVVDSLPTANIKETTVYLLKSGDESDNLYTEYIYKNGKWEKLGSQTLDLSKYAEKSTTLKGYGITDGATKEEVSRLSQEIVDLKEGNVTVSDYWVDELETKANDIQVAMEKAGKNKSAFLWYTDAHWISGNSKVSPMLLNYLYMNTPMNKVNFGGDIIGDTLLATREEMKYLYEWRKAIKDLPNHHSVFGNHDMFELDSVDYEDNNYRYAFLLAPEETPDQVWGDGNYYYIDNPAEKTRYLYIAYLTDLTSMLAQGQFICDSIKSVQEDWHIVAISHRWWQYSSASTPTTGALGSFEDDLLEVFDAYNARQSRGGSSYFYAQDFTEAKGKVEFCIGGHIHVDYDIFSKGGIPVIITTADANQNRVPDSTVDSGTVGTITEAAVFGIIADYNEEAVKITVVGVGRGTSRVVRASNVKPTSISNISYSGDTTVETVIDKSKFSFTVNYSDGSKSSVNGASTVAPMTIGVVGNNAVTITYVENGVTLTGTVTIIGTAKPVLNLFNLDRDYVSGTTDGLMRNYLDEDKAYLNCVHSAEEVTFYNMSCTVSDVSENSVTVKEGGAGGIYVGYPIYLPDISSHSYRITFDYEGAGKCRTLYRYALENIMSGQSELYKNETAGASGSADVIIPPSTGFKWLILFFSSNTGQIKSFKNITLTKVD